MKLKPCNTQSTIGLGILRRELSNFDLAQLWTTNVMTFETSDLAEVVS